jgi:hypothetical protein
MGKSVREWLHEGEELYNIAVREFQAIEAQIAHLEAQLAAKKDEVNQIAQVIGKPAVDGGARRPPVQIIDTHTPGAIPASRATIAKALAGRGLGT